MVKPGIEIELVEEEVIGVDGRDVVWLEGRLGKVAEVEGDDDFGIGAYGGSQNVSVLRIVRHTVNK